jgi:hypothetical protein
VTARAWPPGSSIVSLEQLAAEYGCSTANLRQRIARGTLTAEKFGRVWVVQVAEAERLIRERDQLEVTRYE